MMMMMVMVCGDYGAQHEMVESLVELAMSKQSPWLQDYDWSTDAKSLRELAIRTPWIVNEQFVCNHFKSIRLVDKCVSELSQQFTHSVFWFLLNCVMVAPSLQ